jgi:opacity protein-like surface antigen
MGVKTKTKEFFMKKVLAIALLCAVSSFATWDKFPVQEAGKGEAKVGLGYLMNLEATEKTSLIGASLEARYSIIEGLEAAIHLPFVLSASGPYEKPDESKSCEAAGDFVCPPTYAPPVIGVRYWLPFGLGIALDVALPLQGDAYAFGGMKDGAKNQTSLDIIPAVQYSTNLTSELSLGSEVSLTIPGEYGDEIKAKDGMSLGIGVEFDYAIGNITPYVGVDVGLGLTSPKVDGDSKDPLTGEDYEAAKTTIDIGLGAIFKINDSMGADIGVTYGIGEGYKGIDSKGEENTISPITILAHFSYYF